MRNVPADLDPEVVAEIDRRLRGVADEHDVSVPWAIESGSRAWGFPSPDSDYDCRFFFVRPADHYLDPWRPRDVIETPLDEVFDVNGWDLIKAVQLAVSGNATVGEWLRSPIVYDGEQGFRDDLLDLVNTLAQASALQRHYRHVGLMQWQRSGAATGDEPRLKGVFYALRPATVLHWMRAHGSPAAPMNLGELMDQAPPADDVLDAVGELVARKAVTRELGVGPVPTPIRRFVEEQLGPEDPPVEPVSQSARHEAAERFRAMVDRWAPG